MTEAVLHEYQWLVIVGAFAAFAFGWATGSNDVANAFGTSVGAKTLTLKQAVIIASVFEFAGALILGRVSTSTIAGGIANIATFQREPEMYAYGMVCALFAGFAWQAWASYNELNVSATHSIIGSIIGFSLVYGGSSAVNWSTRVEKGFPPYTGVVPIVVSWFFSPVFTGLAAAFFFFLCRTFVLRRANSYQVSFWVLPLAVLVTSWINIFFILTKGAKKEIAQNDKSWTDQKAAWISAIVAVGLAVLTATVALPLLRKSVDKHFEEKDAAAAKSGDMEMAEKDPAEKDPAEKDADKEEEAPKSVWQKFRDMAMHGMEVDIHEVVEEDPLVKAIHERAEVFDPKTERTFSYLQVFSAICVIMAHGAGEVGYMTGPLGSIYHIYKEGKIVKKFNPEIWIIFIGGIGLVTGLATYGYNVTRAMGTRMAKLSPTRGFAAELATAFVILIGSQYRFPTSSSQCITGGIIGVGMMDGVNGVNWEFFAKTFSSWVLTLFVVGFATAALFAQGVYSPNMISGKDQRVYEDRLVNLTSNMYKQLNSTLLDYQQAALAGKLTYLSADQWAALNKTVSDRRAIIKTQLDVKKVQTVAPEYLMDLTFQAVATYQNFTVLTLGQQKVQAGGATPELKTLVCNDNTTAPADCKAPAMIPKEVTSWKTLA